MTSTLTVTKTVLEGTPLIEDPLYWALVAFTLIENSHQREGLTALDAAIDMEQDPLNKLFRQSASWVVNMSQAERLGALRSFREMHRLEIEALRAAGGQGANSAEMIGKQPR